MCRKIKVLVLLAFCMMALNVLSVNTVQAANTNKKTLTTTIDRKNWLSYKYEFTLTQKTKLNAELKALSIKGKGKNTKTFLGSYHVEGEKGPLFDDLKK